MSLGAKKLRVKEIPGTFYAEREEINRNEPDRNRRFYCKMPQGEGTDPGTIGGKT